MIEKDKKMSEIVLPTLSSTASWVINKYEIVNKVFNYFLISEKSQSNLFKKDIASLKYLIAMSKDEISLSTAIKNTLTDLYQDYFDKVGIDVNTVDKGGILDINISGVFYDKETKYTLSKELGVKNNEILY